MDAVEHEHKILARIAACLEVEQAAVQQVFAKRPHHKPGQRGEDQPSRVKCRYRERAVQEPSHHRGPEQQRNHGVHVGQGLEEIVAEEPYRGLCGA